ncbi:fungal-specific transcription factor domain-containing protein [Trichoderma compactum]
MPVDDAEAEDVQGSATGSEDKQAASKKRKLSSRDNNQENEGPACQNCRKKKSACSRTQPCSACVRYNVECVYYDGRAKTGVRTGAIESINQRIASLQQMLLGQSILWNQLFGGLDSPTSGSVENTSTDGFTQENLEQSITQLRNRLTSTYFEQVHQWIPMLHVLHFRQRLLMPNGRESASTIFYAITSICARFSNDPRLVIILRSMESFSVENLQALTICSFDLIGGGRGPSAWSSVGSMTRIVERLQLSVEEEDKNKPLTKTLIRRMNFLPRCRCWSETEERRRVFWNIFIMDRFCSIATGWNFSLTSADVKRKLPCEGSLWERGQPLDVPTPYFGIADSTSRANPAVPTARPDGEDQDLLGGFAFCIEATESLSLVTSFFLQHDLDFSDPHQFQLWLVRFKQLDLRLVQWKIFLPKPWREACVLNADGNMDPNLTLAHMTHNTAAILLHQVIAFPLPEWQSQRLRLPSLSSAETCFAAATEVSIIAEAYLQRSTSLTIPQLAFCLFICGRLLLAYSSYHSQPLAPSLNSLVSSLYNISSRWNGPFSDDINGETHNLVSKFATRLTQARQHDQHILDIREPVYSDDQREGSGSGPGSFTHGVDTTGVGVPTPSLSDLHGASPDSISMAFPPLPLSLQGQISYGGHSKSMPIDSPRAGVAIGVQPTDPMMTEVHSYDGVDAFFDPSFPPDQRVSVFSYSNYM